MRACLTLLFVLALAGCGGDSSEGPDGRRGSGPDLQGPGAGGPDGPQPGRRPSDALLAAPDPDKNKSSLQDAGPEMQVRIVLAKNPGVDRGQFVFVGVPEDGLEESWLRSGRRPSFFWVSPLVSFEPPIELMAPLPKGLFYFAVLNLDGDDLPGPDDLVSPAVHYDPASPDGAGLDFQITARLGDVLPGDSGEEDGEADPPPGDEGGEVRTLIVGNNVRLPFIRTGRFMVVGLPPSPEDEFGYPPDSTPSFLWVSEGTRLKWPVTLQAKLPDAVDLLVVLDLDASGAPDVGDLTTEPLFRFRRPPAGDYTTVTLQTVVPVPEGESNEEERPGDGVPVEGPEEPDDEDSDEAPTEPSPSDAEPSPSPGSPPLAESPTPAEAPPSSGATPPAHPE